MFKEVLSVMSTFKAKLHLKPGCKARFCKARNVCFTLKPAVQAELSWLIKERILEQIKHSHWVAPVIPVSKNDGRLQLCGDSNVFVNSAMEVDKYLLSKLGDLFALNPSCKSTSQVLTSR